MSRSLGTYSMKMAKSGPWNRMKIKLLFDYHSLILLVEDANLIFPTTFIVKKSKSTGTSVYWPWIIREAIVLRRKWRLRARGSFRIQKGCYLGGPWDKSEPPCHSCWNRLPMTCTSEPLSYEHKCIFAPRNIRWTMMSVEEPQFFFCTSIINGSTLHCLIEDTCLLFSRTAFLLDASYCTLDEYLKDRHVYYCTLDFDW